MTVELLQILSLVSYILAGVCFVIAIAMFFILGVPDLIGDISGATARKAIEQIRQQNEQSGDKAYKASPVNLARGKVTDKITPSGRLKKRTDRLGVHVGTQKFATGELMSQAQDTCTPEMDAPETSVLASPVGETTVLSNDYGDTTVLSEGVGETTVLNAPAFTDAEREFVILVELAFTGSTEIIE